MEDKSAWKALVGERFFDLAAQSLPAEDAEAVPVVISLVSALRVEGDRDGLVQYVGGVTVLSNDAHVMRKEIMEALEQQIAALQGAIEEWKPEQVLRWGISRFGPSMAVASSFGAEDVALMRFGFAQGVEVSRLHIGHRFFFLPETYELIDVIQRRYGIEVERTRPELTPEEQAAKFRPALWGSRPRSVLRYSQGPAAEEATLRTKGVGDRRSPRSSPDTRKHQENRVGR